MIKKEENCWTGLIYITNSCKEEDFLDDFELNGKTSLFPGRLEMGSELESVRAM